MDSFLINKIKYFKMGIVTFPLVVIVLLTAYMHRGTGVELFNTKYDLFGFLTSSSNIIPAPTNVLQENMILWLVLYFSSYLILYVIPEKRLLYKYKFDPLFTNNNKLLIKEIGRSFRGIMICSGMEIYMNLLIKNHYRQYDISLLWFNSNIVTLPELIIAPLVLYIYSDLHFYLIHRLLHTKWLYKNVHKYHHESNNPNPFSGLSMHTLESMLYFSSPLIIGLIGFPSWYYRLLFKALIIFPLEGHCGYGNWKYENSYNHYIHHSKFNWNYGSSPIFDILLGTNYPSKVDKNSKTYKIALEQATLSGFKENVIEMSAQ